MIWFAAGLATGFALAAGIIIFLAVAGLDEWP